MRIFKAKPVLATNASGALEFIERATKPVIRRISKRQIAIMVNHATYAFELDRLRSVRLDPVSVREINLLGSYDADSAALVKSDIVLAKFSDAEQALYAHKQLFSLISSSTTRRIKQVGAVLGAFFVLSLFSSKAPAMPGAAVGLEAMPAVGDMAGQGATMSPASVESYAAASRSGYTFTPKVEIPKVEAPPLKCNVPIAKQ